jgi:hypothetical protein
MSITGRCHCGTLVFELGWNAEQPDIPARACGCGFCTRHGAAWTSHPDARLRIRAAAAGRVNAYRFGTRTADFHVCATCGNAVFASCEIDGRLHAVVNVNLFDDEARERVRRAATEFGDEDRDERLERRRRTWIADVEYVTA